MVNNNALMDARIREKESLLNVKLKLLFRRLIAVFVVSPISQQVNRVGHSEIEEQQIRSVVINISLFVNKKSEI